MIIVDNIFFWILIICVLYYFFYDNSTKLLFLNSYLNNSYLKYDNDIINFYYDNKHLININKDSYVKSLYNINKIIEISITIENIDYYYSNYLDNAKMLSEKCLNYFESIILSTNNEIDTSKLQQIIKNYINRIENICIIKFNTQPINITSKQIYKNLPKPFHKLSNFNFY